MKGFTKLMLLALSLGLLFSCHRRPLFDLEYTHYVRVYLDEELKNVTTGFYNEKHLKPEYSTPKVVRVVLCHPETGQVMAERYLQNPGSDERGNYLDGYISAGPGEYKLLAYSFGTESTILRNEGAYHRVEAYTNPISSYLYGTFNVKSRAEGEKIVYDPDHMFVDNYENLKVDYKSHIDTLYNENGDYFTAQSIVKTYYIQVTIEGAQYISSAVALLNGMGGSSVLYTGPEPNNDPATIYFDMIKSGTEGVSDEMISGAQPTDPVKGVMYSNFGTFGKLESMNNELEMSFDVITTDGRKLSYKLDITHKFYEDDAIRHQWIIIRDAIVIPPPDPNDPNNPGGNGSGGFIPNVDEWQDIETEIII